LQDQLGNNRLQLEDLKKTKTEMELELSRLKGNQDDLERKLKYSTDLVNTLSLELARDKNDKRFIADKLAAIKEENSTLRAQVKDLATAKVSLNRSLQKLSQEKTDIETQLSKTEEIIQNRVSDMIDIKNELEAANKARAATGIEGKVVQLPPIIVKAQGMGQKETASSTGSERTAARVVSLNESNNFVIIDIGASSGVKPGDSFKVYHDAKEIAIVEVIQARNDISAADIKQKIQNISVGDLVK
jgi:chromosome segregation ATPase